MEETDVAIPFVLHCDDTHKVKVIFGHFGHDGHERYIKMADNSFQSICGTIGDCVVCPMSYVCAEENETDLWYKEIDSDGSFRIYVKDVTGMKYYLRGYISLFNPLKGSFDTENTYMICYTKEIYQPQHYIIRDGKIIVKDESTQEYDEKVYDSKVEEMIGIARWYGDVLEEVEDIIESESLFIDSADKKYCAVAVFYYGQPLKLTKRTVICRLPLLKYYTDVNA